MTDNNHLATIKADTQLLRAEMMHLHEAIALFTENVASKDDLKQFATKDDLKQFATKDDLRDSEERLKRYIDVKLENQAYDILGAQKDKFEEHSQQIAALQIHTGLRR
jgi:hypothetical protein